LITKAIVQSISADGTRCRVRIPLFETSASNVPIEAEALVSITPGVFNNLEVDDRVFIAFEENAIERPIILGKLFRGADIESTVRGGGAIFNSLKVSTEATIPASTIYVFPDAIQKVYTDLKTPKKMADYIKWLESFSKNSIAQLEDNFNCFKNWTQWQLQSENVEVDDGDLDMISTLPTPFQYQEEGSTCKICATCTKNNIREYLKLPSDKIYPDI
jgi:hypothetical protein